MKIVLGLIFALFSTMCFAGATPDQEYILNTQMGPAAHKVQMGTLIRQNQAMAIGKFSVAVQGGKSTLTVAGYPLLTDLGNKKSYLYLPANAVITNVWLYTLTPFQLSTSATGLTAAVSMSTLNVGDILASSATTRWITNPAFIAGVPAKATTTTWIKMPTNVDTRSTINVVITGKDLGSGVFNAYIEYVLGN